MAKANSEFTFSYHRAKATVLNIHSLPNEPNNENCIRIIQVFPLKTNLAEITHFNQI